MPSAGAVAPPVIRPLRAPIPGRSAVHIDSNTYLEIYTETSRCKIYFTTDGTKPDAFQNRSGKESTFRYRAPFVLNPGRRLIKTIAVSRDGLRQSDVVSRSFLVDDVNPGQNGSGGSIIPIEDDNGEFTSGPSEIEDVVTFGNSDRNKVIKYKKARHPNGRQREIVEEIYEETIASDDERYTMTDTARSAIEYQNGRPSLVRSATETTVHGRPHSGNTAMVPYVQPGTPHVVIDGNRISVPPPPVCYPVPPPQHTPHHPVMAAAFGAPPARQPVAWGASQAQPFNRLGYMTDKMLHRLEQSRDFTVAEMRRTIEDCRRAPSPPPFTVVAREPPEPAPPVAPPPPEPPVVREPPLHAVSPGNGLWREQVQHVYSHLLQYAKDHVGFRVAIAEPRMGDINGLEFEETEDAYVLKLELARFDQPMTPAVRERPIKPSKPKGEKVPSTIFDPKPVVNPEPKPKPKPKPEPPRPAPVKKPDPPPPKKPVERPKPKPNNADDYLRTEEDENSEGTIKPLPYHNVERDCEKLRKAMKGIGTDEQALIDVMGARSAVQRVEIDKKYKFMYGKDLKANFDSETSGNFRDCLIALATAPADYDAAEMRRAVKGAGTDEDCLVEIVCTRTNAQLKMMKQAYKKLYNRDVEKDVTDDTSGDFKHVMIGLLQGIRDESKQYDMNEVKKDAKELYEAGEGKLGTDESKFVSVLVTRSYAHLRAVFKEYRRISKRDIEDALKSEMSGDVLQAFLAIVRCIRNKHGYFALALYKSMKGLGTDDKALVRICVTRCEIDMVQIKQEFKEKYSQTLEKFIEDDTSGDYLKLLLKLVIGNADECAAAEKAGPTEPEPGEIKEEELKENTERPEEQIDFFQTEPELDQSPTLKPAPDFDARADCEKLRKAMKGLGTDEQAIIDVMAYRSVTQRLEIVKNYKSMYGKDLAKELKSETSGNFQRCLEALCKAPDEYDSYELRRAMKGAGTDEDALIEIICTRTNKQIDAVKDKYKELYPGRDLEKDIVSETSGDLKHLLISLLQAQRPETRKYDVNKVKADAQALVDAGAKFKTDKAKMIEILCTRSNSHLRAVFEEFKNVSTKTPDIEDYLKKEMSGDILKSLLTLVRCIRNKAGYFAYASNKAMKGAGTDDESLSRVVITRCEIDMVQIKDEFEKQFKGSLGEWIKDDTSGDYRKTLMALIGEPMTK